MLMQCCYIIRYTFYNFYIIERGWTSSRYQFQTITTTVKIVNLATMTAPLAFGSDLIVIIAINLLTRVCEMKFSIRVSIH